MAPARGTEEEARPRDPPTKSQSLDRVRCKRTLHAPARLRRTGPKRDPSIEMRGRGVRDEQDPAARPREGRAFRRPLVGPRTWRAAQWSPCAKQKRRPRRWPTTPAAQGSKVRTAATRSRTEEEKDERPRFLPRLPRLRLSAGVPRSTRDYMQSGRLAAENPTRGRPPPGARQLGPRLRTPLEHRGGVREGGLRRSRITRLDLAHGDSKRASPPASLAAGRRSGPCATWEQPCGLEEPHGSISSSLYPEGGGRVDSARKRARQAPAELRDRLSG